jgi:hypothetical protein
MPKRVIDLFACWWKFGRPRSAAVWTMVPICIFWCVWKKRNLKCFKDQENSIENILDSFFHTLYLWTVAFLSLVSISYSDFLIRFSFSCKVFLFVYFQCTKGRLTLLINLFTTYQKKNVELRLLSNLPLAWQLSHLLEHPSKLGRKT